VKGPKGHVNRYGDVIEFRACVVGTLYERAREFPLTVDINACLHALQHGPINVAMFTAVLTECAELAQEKAS